MKKELHSILAVFFMIAMFCMAFASLYLISSYNLVDEEKIYECYLKIPTNLTFDSFEHKIRIKDNECYYEVPHYYEVGEFREKGTLTYFLFGSGKGTSVRYEIKTINLDK